MSKRHAIVVVVDVESNAVVLQVSQCATRRKNVLLTHLN